jgi:hypothetical protein
MLKQPSRVQKKLKSMSNDFDMPCFFTAKTFCNCCMSHELNVFAVIFCAVQELFNDSATMYQISSNLCKSGVPVFEICVFSGFLPDVEIIKEGMAYSHLRF